MLSLKIFANLNLVKTILLPDGYQAAVRKYVSTATGCKSRGGGFASESPKRPQLGQFLFFFRREGVNKPTTRDAGKFKFLKRDDRWGI